MFNIIMNGCNGKMGKEIISQAEMLDDVNVIAKIDKDSDDSFENVMEKIKKEIDVQKNNNNLENGIVVIDFSHREGTMKALQFCLENNIAILIGTTGLAQDDYEKIHEASKKIPLTLTSNTSQGINLMRKIMKLIGEEMNHNWHVEIFEKHHDQKKDAPSGTAITLRDDLANSLDDGRDIPTHAYRGGTIPGEHSIIIAGIDETIEITHTAFSRKIFAIGAIEGAKKLLS